MQRRILRGSLDKLVDLVHQFGGGFAGTVLDIALKPAGHAQPHNRGHAERIADAFRAAHADTRKDLGQCIGRIGGSLTFVPVGKRDETDARIGILRRRQNIVAVNSQNVGDVRIFGDFGRNGIRKLLRPRQRRSRRHIIGHQQVAHVFHRHQSARHNLEQSQNAQNNADKTQNGNFAIMQKQFDTGQIPFGYLLKKDVKPAEKTRRFMSFLMRFDYQGAERRCQCQRYQRRNQHRDGNRYRELLIHHAGHAAEKSNRQKDRRQNQRHGDNRTGNLLHGLNRRFFRRKPLFAHQTFDVFKHDNRVVNDNADGQNEAEQSQQID